MYYAILVKLQVFSDTSVHLSYTSASSPVYPFPPPTTLLGALAYPYLMYKGIVSEILMDPHSGDLCSPAVELVDTVPYASAGSRGYVGYRSLERIYELPYLREEYQKRKEYWWGVAQRGGIVFRDDELYVLYITRNPDIAKYAWGIVRIGRKESHVNVREVYVESVREARTPGKTLVHTFMYAPTRLFDNCENAIEVDLPIISRENMCRAVKPALERFFIPLEDGMKCLVRGAHGTVLNIGGVSVVVPKEYIEDPA